MRTDLKRVQWLRAVPFFLMHLSLLLVFFVPFDWQWVGLAVVMYYLRMFGVTAGYHRYFAHKSFKTSRVMQFLLAFLAQSSAQKGALWWASHHRHHHRYSGTDKDIHAPEKKGFWWSHVLWILVPDYAETDYQKIRDFAKYPELRWLNEYSLVPPFVLAVMMLLIGGWSALVWGFFVSTLFLYHGTFVINSLSHMLGKRRYQTQDDSRNNWFLALLTMGEGWHNNHHYHQASVRQGFFWWEFDPTYCILKVMSWFGLVWDLKVPPRKVYEVVKKKQVTKQFHFENVVENLSQ